MKTIEMEIALMAWFDYRRNIIVNNISGGYSDGVYFETDIFVLTPRGYATAVEIKVSLADLRKDLKKSHIRTLSDKPVQQNSYWRNIKTFYYAVPEKLQEAALAQIPDFAGLLVVRKSDYGWDSVNVVRAPKLINNVKWTDKMMLRIARLGTIRIFDARNREVARQNDIEFRNAQKKEGADPI